MFIKSAVLATLAAVPVALGQTFTDCDPTKKTCPADPGLETASFSSDFTQGKSAISGWSPAAGTYLNYGANGAEFTIAKEGNAPTIESDFTFLFGTLEVVMQAAPGQGIVSSIVLESADLDEVDWEFIGSDYAQVQSNYYGKGNTTSYDRVVYHKFANPQNGFHTYKFDWTKDRIVYSIDGAPVRTLAYADANGGSNYPQTPMRVKLGNWSGGQSNSPKGTVEWAGGYTDYTKAPFTMYVKSVKVTNANPAKEYVWTDMSGSYQSIKVVAGDGKNSFLSGSGSSSSSSTTKSIASSSTTTPAPKSSSTAHSSSHSSAAPLTTAKPVLRPNVNATSDALNATTLTSSHTTSSSASRTSSSSAPTSTTNAAASLSPALGGVVLLFTLAISAWML